jgi:phage-related protein
MPFHDESRPPKPIRWTGSTSKDLRSMPKAIRAQLGLMLDDLQHGVMVEPPHAKQLKGFGGGVLELLADHEGDTYRGVVALRCEDAIYVLHVFQKKSKRGIATSQQDIQLIRERLRQAEAHHTATRLDQRGPGL